MLRVGDGMELKMMMGDGDVVGGLEGRKYRLGWEVG